MSTLPYPPPQQHQRQPEPGYPQQDPGRDAPYNPPPAIGVPVTSGAQHYNHSAYNNQNYGPTGMVVVQPAAGPIISPEHYWRASMCGDAECDVVCGACCTPCVAPAAAAVRRLKQTRTGRPRRAALRRGRDVLYQIRRDQLRELRAQRHRAPVPRVEPPHRGERARGGGAVAAGAAPRQLLARVRRVVRHLPF